MRYQSFPVPIRLAFVLLSVGLAIGCSESAVDPAVEPRVTTVVASPSNLHFMAPGDTFRVGAVAYDGMETLVADASVAWVSSNPTVVEVDPSGRVEAMSPGEAILQAKAGDVTGEVPVRVDDRPGITCSDDPVTIERIDDEPFHWYYDTKIPLEPDSTGMVVDAIGSDTDLMWAAFEEAGVTPADIRIFTSPGHGRLAELPPTTGLAEARAAVEILRQDPRLTFASLAYRRSDGHPDRPVNRLAVQFDEQATSEEIVCLNRAVGLTVEAEKSSDGYFWLTLPRNLEPLSVANFHHLSPLTEWAHIDAVGEGRPY